jgi:hypothetical protein
MTVALHQHRRPHIRTNLDLDAINFTPYYNPKLTTPYIFNCPTRLTNYCYWYQRCPSPLTKTHRDVTLILLPTPSTTQAYRNAWSSTPSSVTWNGSRRRRSSSPSASSAARGVTAQEADKGCWQSRLHQADPFYGHQQTDRV